MAKGGKAKKPPPRPAPAAAGQKPLTATPEAEVRRGWAAFARGEYGEAIQIWQRLRRTADAPGLRRALAEVHFRRALAATNPERRQQDVQEAATLAPDHAAYQLHLGLAHQRLGQSVRARAALEAAVRLAPTNDRLRCCLALALLSDPATAAQAPPALDGAAPLLPAVVRLRALARWRTGEPAGAAALLKAAPSSSPLLLVELGLSRLAAGDAPGALAALQAAPRSAGEPLTAEARQATALGLALAHLRRGAPAAAFAALRQEAPPTDLTLRRALTEALQQTAAALARDERLEDAAAAWEQALTFQPGAVAVRRCLERLHEALATRAARAGDREGAAAHWEAALRHAPENTRALRNLALAEERLERWPQASAHWEALLRLWRKEPQPSRRSEEAAAERRRHFNVAYSHLAGAYETAGDPRAAARALDQALNFDASDVDLRLRAAARHMENEDYAGAIDHYRRALAERPRDVQILVDLGSAYDLRGNDRQAMSTLEQAHAIDPAHPAVAPAMAGVLHNRGHKAEDSRRYEEAAVLFRRAAALEPTALNHLDCLGGVYLALGRPDDAKAAFRRVLDAQPRGPQARVAIARRYLEHGFKKEADNLVRQALRIEDSVICRTMIGLMYLTRGYLSDAQRHFKRVLKEGDAGTLLLIGNSLNHLDYSAEAIPYLERAVALEPDLSGPRLALAFAYVHGRGDVDRAAAAIAAAETLARAEQDQEALDEISNIRRTLQLLRTIRQTQPDGDLPNLLGGLR